MAKQQEPMSKPDSASTGNESVATARAGSGKSGLAFFALIVALLSLISQAWMWLNREPSDFSDAVTRLHSSQQAQQADYRSMKNRN